MARNDVVPFLTGRARAVDDVAVDAYSDHDALKSTGSHAANDDASDPHSEKNIRENRAFVLGLGVLTVLISILMARLDNGGDLVVASLTVAYDILVGGLAAQALVRLDLDGDRVAGEARYLEGIGRVRDVAVAADGSLMLLTDADNGQMVRVTRAE